MCLSDSFDVGIQFDWCAAQLASFHPLCTAEEFFDRFRN